MSVTPNYVPREYKTINILLTVNDGEKAIRFYNNAFGAQIREKFLSPDGLIQYAELQIEDTVLMLKEVKSFEGAKGASFQIYTGDAEGLFESAVMAGAKEVSPIEVMFYGDRSGTVKDPFGYEWTIATHMEDVPPNELKKRFDEYYS